MRFAVLATVFAGAAMAESTIYTTEYFTTTSCAATVTNCPARSTVVSSSSYPVGPASSYPVASSSPVVYYNTSTPVETPTYPATTSTYVAVPTSSPEGVLTSSSVSLSTITISTCVPTVIYSTVTVTPSPTSTPAGPVGPGGPVGTGTISHYPSAPTGPAPPAFTGAASSVQGSVIVAAAAGLAAFLFA